MVYTDTKSKGKTMTMLFTKEFLQELTAKSDNSKLIDYVMIHEKLSFHDAIVSISKYFNLEPEYIPEKEENKVLHNFNVVVGFLKQKELSKEQFKELTSLLDVYIHSIQE